MTETVLEPILTLSDVVLDLGLHMQPFGKEFMQMIIVQQYLLVPSIVSE